MAKISIIVPVYNAEKYLRECLDSLTAQTFSDIEILCINDGSTDSSLSILEEYAQKDGRIKVFSQENQGPSVARNLGLENAQGDYITFVDSDDWVSGEMCEKTYKKAVSTNADAVLFSHYRTSNGHIIEDDRLGALVDTTGGEVFDFNSNTEIIVEMVPVETVGKLYKRSFLKEYELRFPISIRLCEDMCFFYNLCLKNPKITVLSLPFYYYRINTQNSLIKRPDAIKMLYRGVLYVKQLYSSADTKKLNNFYSSFLKRISKTFVYFWNNCYTVPYKKTNFKYLIFLYNQYKKFSTGRDNECKMLKECITEYRWHFLQKFFEPVFQIENRSMRIVLYLFGNQVLNLSKLKFKYFYYSMFYTLILWKLHIVSNFRKIRVGFWVTESSKWSNDNIYNEFKNNDKFEPFILLSYFKNPQGNISPKKYYADLKNRFEEKGMKVYETFNPDDYDFEPLERFKPDIIFYQQPWLIAKDQLPEKIHKNSLLCYIPYCFYSMNSHLNYLANFQGIMWKYFVETDMHKKEYEKFYGAKNCVVSGSTKLDGYHFINKENAEKNWKTSGKKRIIYAPHHSFNDGLHEVATFRENGKFILDLAKSHPETEWIFRPHPAFMDRIIKNSIMTADEISRYYEDWRTIGTISEGGNYYEMFSASDCLITDCISFLSEYAPTGKPVLHLKKDRQKEDFNELVRYIDSTYYQIYSNEDLDKIFRRVLLDGDDYLKEQRENNIKILSTGNLAYKNIYDYIKKELRV